jgi:hypothetical protein
MGKNKNSRQFKVLTVVTKSTVFWYVMMCILVEVYQCFGEMLVNLHQITWHHIPEVNNL